MLELNRRDSLMLTAAGLTWTLALGGCEKIAKQIRNRPVRRDVSTLNSSSQTLATYRDGIAKMQALPASDPRNWSNIAALHLNHCPHGNWFFLPWHRAYLMSLESIIRKLTGDASFALPYWNWQCQRAIPAPFWESGSVLSPATPPTQPQYGFTRAVTASDQADPSMVGPATINGILAETDFVLFGSGYATALRGTNAGGAGKLEATPHNYIHGSFIRGMMASYSSPLDPIFYLHHNILDYLWFVWNNSGNANSGDPAWASLNMSGIFVDGDGNPADYLVAAMPLAPLISYRFEAPGGCIRPFRFADEAVLKRFLEKREKTEFKPVREFPLPPRPIALDALQQPRAQVELPPEAARAALEQRESTRLLLRLDNVAAPPDAGTYVRVFVGLPEGAEPSPDSPHYAGAFAFFGDARHPMAFNTHVDIGPIVERLAAQGGASGPTISFVAVPAQERAVGKAAGPIRIGSVTPVLIPRRAKPKPLQ